MKESLFLAQPCARAKLFLHQTQASGFALPMALAIGLFMVAIAGATVLVGQNTRNAAVHRREIGASILVGDSAIARALVQLSNPNNGVLLTRNYDPINPKTGKTYLGEDSVLKSGDETTQAVDEWTGYNPSSQPCFQQLGWTAPNMALTGNIGTEGSYTIRAYRYDKKQQLGTVLVDGNYKGQISTVAITISIEPVLDNFPGILLVQANGGDPSGVLALRGRQILGSKGNIYYPPANSAAPSLTGNSAPGDTARPNYLNAIYSSSAQDGAHGDTVGGKIFACKLSPWIPASTLGKNLGVINTSKTLVGVGGNVPTLYQAEEIDLDKNETLKVDTTGGPVYIDLINNSGLRGITLRQNAQILNTRTDRKLPRVGDLRIMSRLDSLVTLYDHTCIQDAFLWFNIDELRLFTSGPGCPSGKNTNVEGVVWMEAILNAKQAKSNRNVNYLGVKGESYDTTTQTGVTSGIAVPDDVTSLLDLLEYVDWPVRYKYGTIKNWRRMY